MITSQIVVISDFWPSDSLLTHITEVWFWISCSPYGLITTGFSCPVVPGYHPLPCLHYTLLSVGLCLHEAIFSVLQTPLFPSLFLIALSVSISLNELSWFWHISERDSYFSLGVMVFYLWYKASAMNLDPSVEPAVFSP